MTRLVASPSKTALRARPWPIGIGRAGRDGLRGHDVDRHPVLGVHHDQAAVPRGLLHRPQDRAVVAVEDARVGGEELEVGHALGDQRVHLGERVVVDVAHDHVEAVVGDGVALGLGVPGVEALAERRPAAWTAKSTIDVVPPKAAARVPVSNVSLANVAAEGQLHVRVDVDAARDHVLAGRVDGLVGGHAGPGEVGADRRRSARRRRGRPRRSSPSAVTMVPLVMSVRIGPSWATGVGRSGG